MELLLLFFLIFLLPSSSSFSSPSTMLASTAAKDVFILAGQTNMMGYGGVVNYTEWDGVVPPECRAAPRILRLGEDLKWEEAREPLHLLTANPTPGRTFGIGPGMPFAHSLLERDSAIGTIGLVPCAVRGSYLRYWSREGANYTNMVTRARAAVADGSVLRALLWYQGEADSGNVTDAAAYRRRLVDLFDNVRADLHSPTLPIIQVALASGSLLKEEIRKVQLLNDLLLPNVTCVDAKGLPLIPGDNLHLTTPAQIKLGSMLADAYMIDLKLSPAVVGMGVENFAYLHLHFYVCMCLLIIFMF